MTDTLTVPARIYRAAADRHYAAGKLDGVLAARGLADDAELRAAIHEYGLSMQNYPRAIERTTP